jgi:hypothetical protein
MSHKVVHDDPTMTKNHHGVITLTRSQLDPIQMRFVDSLCLLGRNVPLEVYQQASGISAKLREVGRC